MPVWEDFKAKGNEAFRAGRFREAVRTYTAAIASTASSPFPPDILPTLFSNRSAALLKIGSYQAARFDAEEALRWTPNDQKARFRLASAFFHLRSYRKALDALRPMQALTNNDEIQRFLCQVNICVEENRTGAYDIAAIQAEERDNSRLSHADYCSSALELRPSINGGEGGRGIFTKAIIPQGTLLVASKAIVCGFQDELTSTELQERIGIMRALGLPPSNVAIANVLYVSLGQGCCRAVLDLEGGVSPRPNVDLRRDDVYDTIEDVPDVTVDQLENLIRRNSFHVKKTVSDGLSGGTAVFHVPSFFNHSCMANTVHSHIGDMVFIVSSMTIPEGSEIFLNYYAFVNGESVEQRNKTLQKRTGGFVCRCMLCQYERENGSIVSPAAKVVENMMERFPSPDWGGSRQAVQQLKEARCYLFKQFNQSIPEYDSFKIATFDTESPQRFSLGNLLLPVLRMLASSLHAQRQLQEIIPYIMEIHALIKGNLHFAYEGPLGVPNVALCIWAHHHRHSSREAATAWLNELKSVCSLVGGKKFFEGKYRSLVDDEMAKHPSRESSDA